MANCKICGKPVTAGPVLHPDCWEEKVSKVVEEFCDHFCKFPTISGEEEWGEFMRNNICVAHCPFIPLLGLFEKEG